MTVPFAKMGPTCRDCRDGKHNACNGQALSFDENDVLHTVRCDCAENGHEAGKFLEAGIWE